MILTDEEIVTIAIDSRGDNHSGCANRFARAIEAAILAKIGEPVAWRGVHGWMHTGVKICPTDTPLYRIPEVKNGKTKN